MRDDPTVPRVYQFAERSKVLLKASRLIMARQQELAELETMEHGSPIRKTMNFVDLTGQPEKPWYGILK